MAKSRSHKSAPLLTTKAGKSRVVVAGAIQKPKAISIFGLGLIGGSIADRIRRKSRSVSIFGIDNASVLKKAEKASLIDAGLHSVEEALSSSALIILSATPAANQAILKKLSRANVDTDALIIDTGSTQSSIGELARSLKWRNSASFIAGHPMAGREVAGLDNRVSKLFEGHPFFFDESVALSNTDSKRLLWLIKILGAELAFVDSNKHDKVMTDISHLPQLVSTIIGSFVREHDRQTLALAGTGLQSMIRLGGSQYPIWRDVFAENKENVLESLDSLIEELQSAREEINLGRGLSRRFKQAQRSYQCLW